MSSMHVSCIGAHMHCNIDSTVVSHHTLRVTLLIHALHIVYMCRTQQPQRPVGLWCALLALLCMLVVAVTLVSCQDQTYTNCLHLSLSMLHSYYKS